MKNLQPLNSEQHQQLKITPGAVLKVVDKMHMLQLMVHEVPQAITELPVFFSRNADSRLWSISALTSFVPGQNLLVQDESWQGRFQPGSFATYPLFMIPDSEKQQYVLNIDCDAQGVSDTAGEPLFDGQGQPTPMLNQIKQRLNKSIEQIPVSQTFCQTLENMGLLRRIDLKLNFQDNTHQLIQGLTGINEDALQRLDAASLHDLHQKGYLIPIHGMLMSIYQINRLIALHNQRSGNSPIKGVTFEVAKDATEQ